MEDINYHLAASLLLLVPLDSPYIPKDLVPCLKNYHASFIVIIVSQDCLVTRIMLSRSVQSDPYNLRDY